MRGLLWMTLVMACRCGGSTPPEEVDVEAHFGAAQGLVAAALDGDAAAVASAARALESPGEGAAAGALHGALGFLQVAEGPEELADGLAELASACAGCHAEAGVILSGGLPAWGGGAAHRVAAERAWWATAMGLEAERAAALAQLPEPSTPDGDSAGGASEPLAAALAACSGCHAGPGVGAEPQE